MHTTDERKNTLTSFCHPDGRQFHSLVEVGYERMLSPYIHKRILNHKYESVSKGSRDAGGPTHLSQLRPNPPSPNSHTPNSAPSKTASSPPPQDPSTTAQTQQTFRAHASRGSRSAVGRREGPWAAEEAVGMMHRGDGDGDDRGRRSRGGFDGGNG